MALVVVDQLDEALELDGADGVEPALELYPAVLDVLLGPERDGVRVGLLVAGPHEEGPVRGHALQHLLGQAARALRVPPFLLLVLVGLWYRLL